MEEAKSISVKEILTKVCPREDLDLKLFEVQSGGNISQAVLVKLLITAKRYYNSLLKFDQNKCISFVVSTTGDNEFTQYHNLLIQVFSRISRLKRGDNLESHEVQCLESMLKSMDIIVQVLSFYYGERSEITCDSLIEDIIDSSKLIGAVSENSEMASHIFDNCRALITSIDGVRLEYLETFKLVLNIFFSCINKLMLTTDKLFQIHDFLIDIPMKRMAIDPVPLQSSQGSAETDKTELTRQQLREDYKAIQADEPKYTAFVQMLILKLKERQRLTAAFLKLYTSKLRDLSFTQFINLFMSLIDYVHEVPYEATDITIALMRCVVFEIENRSVLSSMRMTKALFSSRRKTQSDKQVVNLKIDDYLQQIALSVIDYFLGNIRELTASKSQLKSKRVIRDNIHAFIGLLHGTTPLHRIVFFMKQDDWKNTASNCAIYLRTELLDDIVNEFLPEIVESTAAKDLVDVIGGVDIQTYSNLVIFHPWFCTAHAFIEVIGSSVAGKKLFFQILECCKYLSPKRNVLVSPNVFTVWQRTFQALRDVINKHGIYRTSADFVERVVLVLFEDLFSSRTKLFSIDDVIRHISAAIRSLADTINLCSRPVHTINTSNPNGGVMTQSPANNDSTENAANANVRNVEDDLLTMAILVKLAMDDNGNTERENLSLFMLDDEDVVLNLDQINFMDAMPNNNNSAVKSIMFDASVASLRMLDSEDEEDTINAWTLKNIVYPLTNKVAIRLLIFGVSLGTVKPRLHIESSHNTKYAQQLAHIEEKEFQRHVKDFLSEDVQKRARKVAEKEYSIAKKAKEIFAPLSTLDATNLKKYIETVKLAKHILLELNKTYILQRILTYNVNSASSHQKEETASAVDVDSTTKNGSGHVDDNIVANTKLKYNPDTFNKLLLQVDTDVERAISYLIYSLSTVWNAFLELNKNRTDATLQAFKEADFDTLDRFRVEMKSFFDPAIKQLGNECITQFQHNQVAALYVLFGRNNEPKHRLLRALKVGTGQGKTLLQAATAVKFLTANPMGKVLIFSSNQHLSERDEMLMRPLYAHFGYSSVCPRCKNNAFVDPESIVRSTVLYCDSHTFSLGVRCEASSVHPCVNLLKFAHGLEWKNYLVILDEVDVLLAKREPPYIHDSVPLFKTAYASKFVTASIDATAAAAAAAIGEIIKTELKTNTAFTNIAKIVYTVDGIHPDLDIKTAGGESAPDQSQSTTNYVGSFGTQLAAGKLNLPLSSFFLKWKLNEAKQVIGFSGTLHEESLSQSALFLRDVKTSTDGETTTTAATATTTAATTATEPSWYEFWDIPLFFSPCSKHGDIKCHRIFANVTTQLEWLDKVEGQKLLPATIPAHRKPALASLDAWAAEIKQDALDARARGQPVLIFVETEHQKNIIAKPIEYLIQAFANLHICNESLTIDASEQVYDCVKDTENAKLQRIANVGNISICTKIIGRGADIQVKMSVTEGLHIIMTSPDYKEEMMQQIGRTGRMNRKGSYSFIFFAGHIVPQYDASDIMTSDSFTVQKRFLHELSNLFFQNFESFSIEQRLQFAWFCSLYYKNYESASLFYGEPKHTSSSTAGGTADSTETVTMPQFMKNSHLPKAMQENFVSLCKKLAAVTGSKISFAE